MPTANSVKTTTNSAALVATSAGVPVWTSAMTNGQVVIGSTGATPAAATLTAGTNVTLDNAAGSITINAGGAASGGWFFIQTQTAASVASLDFTTGIDSTYSKYVFTLDGITSETDNVQFYVRYSIDGGSNWISTNTYGFVVQGAATGGGSLDNIGTGVAQISLTSSTAGLTFDNTATGAHGSGVLWLIKPSSATLTKQVMGQWTYVTNGGGTGTATFMGTNTTTSAVNGIQFFFSSGDIGVGTITLYGIKDS